MGDWLSSAINGGAGLLSTILTNAANRRQAQKQMEFQSAETDKQNAFNESMMDKQNEWNLNQWNRENEYNSDAQAVQRMRDAGLNPLMGVNGNSNANQLTSAGASASTGTSGAMANIENPVSGLIDMIQAVSDVTLKRKQGDNLDEDSENKRLNNKLLKDTFEVQCKQFAQNLKNSEAQYDQIIEQNKQIQESREYTEEQRRGARIQNDIAEAGKENTLALLGLEVKGKQIENVLNDKKIQQLEQDMKVQMEQLDIQKRLANANIGLLATQIKNGDLDAVLKGLDIKISASTIDDVIDEQHFKTKEQRNNARLVVARYLTSTLTDIVNAGSGLISSLKGTGSMPFTSNSASHSTADVTTHRQ